jgi:putative flippase GtrA
MRRFLRFNVASALGIGVQLGVLWILTRGLHAGYITATILAVSAAVAHNFLWHWRWTWADRAIPIAAAPAALARFAAANGAVSIVGNVIVMAILVQAGLPAIGANLLAIALCGLINYWLGDRVVFAVRSADRTPVRVGAAEQRSVRPTYRARLLRSQRRQRVDA